MTDLNTPLAGISKGYRMHLYGKITKALLDYVAIYIYDYIHQLMYSCSVCMCHATVDVLHAHVYTYVGWLSLGTDRQHLNVCVCNSLEPH